MFSLLLWFHHGSPATALVVMIMEVRAVRNVARLVKREGGAQETKQNGMFSILVDGRSGSDVTSV